MEYKIIRSGRKTIALQVKNGELTVRAPYGKTDSEIKCFVEMHRAWIEKTVNEQLRKINGSNKKLTKSDIDRLLQYAEQVIPQIVAYYAPRVGVTYSKVAVKVLKSKWGSCSSNGNLSFNCLLMLAPREVIESVVVHELCHRKQMNHSDKFYKEVLRVCPNYFKLQGWLKEHGSELIRSIPED